MGNLPALHATYQGIQKFNFWYTLKSIKNQLLNIRGSYLDGYSTLGEVK